MKQIVIALSVLAVVFTSCDLSNKKQAEYLALEQERDSLKLEVMKSGAELEDMLSLLNEIDDNFQKIKSVENYLTVQSAKGGELTPTTKERISNDMKLLAETLQKNKEQISKLQAQLGKSKLNSAELSKMISKLQVEMDSKAVMITDLQAQLSQRDIRIAELDEVVTALSTRSSLQDALIESQDANLHTAYYCFGTAKELKDEKIISGGVFTSSKTLPAGFNKEYFTKVDIRQFTSLPLNSKKATLKSNHPKDSYELAKDPNTKELTLKIINTTEFWSVSRYLVIEVSL